MKFISPQAPEFATGDPAPAGVRAEAPGIVERLAGREDWLEAVFVSAAEAILVHEWEGRLLEVNPAACQMLGYTREELLTLHPWDLLTDNPRGELKQQWQRLERGAALTAERTYRRKDGRRGVAETRLARCACGGQERIILACRDITARRRLEEQLRASEQVARGQVAALRGALEEIAADSGVDRLLGHVLRTIDRQLGAQRASLWLRDQGTDRWVFHLSFEEGRIFTRPDAHHPMVRRSPRWEDEPIGEALAKTRRPIVCEEVEEDPMLAPLRSYLKALGVRTVLVVPLVSYGRVMGCISALTCRRHHYRPEEIDLAQALAHQAALSIQLTRLAEQSRQAAVLEERNRLAREIHDTLAQGFTGIIVQLEAAQETLQSGQAAETGAHLRRAGELARHSLAEARRSVRALRPQALETGGLMAALEKLLKQVTWGTRLEARLSAEGTPRPLPPAWEENLLRIGQEALTNTLKHARADRFAARLVFADGEVRLELRDDGHGFDPNHQNGGFGLRGMRERVERLGGWFSVQSRAGGGTCLRVVVPDASPGSSSAP